jgi:UPF0176 protein
MHQYIVAAFYKFVSLPDYQQRKPLYLQTMQDMHIKGTLILAEEGLNATISGEASDVSRFLDFLQEDTCIGPLSLRISHHSAIPFSKAKVKLRKEIVTLGVAEVHPEKQTGEHVSPEAWNALLADPDVVVVDTRNTYEVLLGSFSKAINPNTVNFRDFPAFVQQELLDKKDKKIAMYCTGGVRCEKSTAYLQQLGFQHVYQLEGGILHYLETVDPKDSLWSGSCFIFDDRLALDRELEALPEGSIDANWKQKHRQAIHE